MKNLSRFWSINLSEFNELIWCEKFSSEELEFLKSKNNIEITTIRGSIDIRLNLNQYQRATNQRVPMVYQPG